MTDLLYVARKIGKGEREKRRRKTLKEMKGKSERGKKEKLKRKGEVKK